MKKLTILMAIMTWGAVASVAQAQDKKNYVIGSLGVYAASGGASVHEEGPDGSSEFDLSVVSNEIDNTKRLGYGHYLNEKLSLEFAFVDFGKIQFEIKNGRSDSEYFIYSLYVYDISAVYHKPLNEKAKLTFRGGFNSYQWVNEDGYAIISTNVNSKSSGTGQLLGIGVEFGDIHVELRSYDLTLISYGLDVYTLPTVLSVGYKARF